LLEELLSQSPSLDDSVLSQVIAAADSYDKHEIMAEYHRRKKQNQEFNRRLLRGQRLC
uniref:CUE domain-containing protein n=1 Tax=Gongylonema pulchrum TaxID=637853 RepID=A0A183EJ97_9BILA